MANKILIGDAGTAFLKVFTPLAQFNGAIEKSKDTCQHDPYVSLRTYCELKLDLIQVYPVIVDNYGTFGSTLKGAATKTRDLLSSALKFTGYVWNTSPNATAQLLKTATDALKSRISDINGALPDDSNELTSLEWEIKQIKSTLKGCRGTVFHVFNTLVDPTSKQYEQGTTLNADAIRAQYDELNTMIDQLKQLKESIQTKLSPREPEVEISQEKSPPVPRNLEFTNHIAASAWFKRQIAQYRAKLQEHNWSGDGCFKDLMALAKNSVQVPKSFYNFTKSLDSAIKDPMVSREFFQKFYERCLSKEPLPPPKDPINNFQELLCHLYIDKAPRAAYQFVFRALLNDAGNGPYGLKQESKIINEIFRSDFFAMFDPEHEVK